jgi:predicted dehydrogenase
MGVIKVGILGAGTVAKKMAETVNAVPQTELAAIGARDIRRANAFADTFHAEKAYGSYYELVSDPDIDLIYVATPHSHHYEHVKLCLEHGRNVICEKAFTANAKQAQELIEIAQSNGLFLMEAMWMRFLPMAKTLKDILDRGVIGRLEALTANLGFKINHKERLVNPALAGGALLDLAVYTIHFASMVLGDEIRNISSTMSYFVETGVDAQEVIAITYKNGAVASLLASFMTNLDRYALIYGTKGRIEIEDLLNFKQFRVLDNNGKVLETHDMPPQINGFEYELLECVNAINEDRTQSDILPLSETLRIMELMDGLRKDWGITFPFEEGFHAVRPL